MTEARAKGATLPKSYKPMHQVDAAKDLSILPTRVTVSVRLHLGSACATVLQVNHLESLVSSPGWTLPRAMVLEAPCLVLRLLHACQFQPTRRQWCLPWRWPLEAEPDGDRRMSAHSDRGCSRLIASEARSLYACKRLKRIHETPQAEIWSVLILLYGACHGPFYSLHQIKPSDSPHSLP